MKIYITKYALSGGILEFDVEKIACDDERNMVEVKRPGNHFTEYFHGEDWHKTRTDAIRKAEKMRVSKVASIKKQLAKLEALTFESQP